MRGRHAIALAELVHVAPYGRDDARHFVALVDFDAGDEVVGGFPVAGVAGAVDDLYEDFVWPGLGDGDVGDLAAEGVGFDDEGLHVFCTA